MTVNVDLAQEPGFNSYFACNVRQVLPSVDNLYRLRTLVDVRVAYKRKLASWQEIEGVHKISLKSFPINNHVGWHLHNVSPKAFLPGPPEKKHFPK